jgi:hypothetical protein
VAFSRDLDFAVLEGVVTPSADADVVAGIAPERVVAVTADDAVVTAAATQGVAAGAAEDELRGEIA